MMNTNGGKKVHRKMSAFQSSDGTLMVNMKKMKCLIVKKIAYYIMENDDDELFNKKKIMKNPLKYKITKG